MIIDGYFISKYWCLLIINILLVISGYSIGGYFVNGYWWLLMLLLSMVIGGYSIVRH
jgi:hypothetical protein